jgi:HK97 family phage portal protein
MFGFKRKAAPEGEARSVISADADAYASGSARLMSLSNMMETATGEAVTVETALAVPAVMAAVNFLSGTMASLPIQVFDKQDDGTVKKSSGDLEGLLNEAPNEGQSSFDWRKYSFDQTFTGGRQISFIERNASRRIIAIWQLDPTATQVQRRAGVKSYLYRENGKDRRFEASEIIDIPFMLMADGLAHRSPILASADVISMAQAATKYGGAYFRSGGIPPYVVHGQFTSGAGMQRAADDLEAAVRKASKEKRQAVVLPTGLDIKTIGTDAEKAQLIETQRFLVEQIARIYLLPPVFLQDLTHGTMSNTEQQDLQLVKHTLRRWVKQAEGELNLKLFGWKNRKTFVKYNLDALLRGDFKTRMEGFAAAIQHGVLTPGEARDLEDRPKVDGSDQLYMQGAMMPINQLGQNGGGNGP